MIEKKYRKIIAKVLVIVMIAVLAGTQRGAVYAAESSGSEEEDLIEYNTAPNIVKDHYFGDIRFWNIDLYRTNGLSTLCCEVTNTGSELFQGIFGIILFDESDQKMMDMLGYIGEELSPGETRTMTSNTDMDLMRASRFEVSMNGAVESIVKGSIVQRRTIENLLIMDNIKLFSNSKNFWTFEFTLDIEDYINYVMPETFELYITFKDNAGEKLFNKTIPIQVKDWGIGFQAFYTTEDLSDASYLEVSTNLPPYTPPAVKPTPTPEPEATPTPVPDETPSSEPDPTGTPLPSESAPPTGTPLPSEPATPTRTPTPSESATPTGTPAPSEPAAPTGTTEPGETTAPTATPAPDATPTPTPVPTTPAASVPTLTPATPPTPTPDPTASPEPEKKNKKLARPIIRVTAKKYRKNIWMAKIKLKKYQGTYIEIYYKRGKGKFKKIKLRQSNIKKNKKLFKVGYKKGKKIIYLRVRTWKRRGGKKIYSLYSKKWRVQ